MERDLSRVCVTNFLGFAGLVIYVWSAGWVAVRQAVRAAGQTDLRGSSEGLAGPWFVVGSRCLMASVASRGLVAHSRVAGSPRCRAATGLADGMSLARGWGLTRFGRSPSRIRRARAWLRSRSGCGACCGLPGGPRGGAVVVALTTRSRRAAGCRVGRSVSCRSGVALR